MNRLALAALGVAILAGVLVTLFLFPAPITSGQTRVPQLRGLTLEAATDTLAKAGLRLRQLDPTADPLVAKGRVAWNRPARGTSLPESAIVRVSLSSGPPTVLVPDLADLDLGTAREVLRAAGLVPGRVDSERAGLPAGMVLRTTPTTRAARTAGDSVNLIVSSGPSAAHLPKR